MSNGYRPLSGRARLIAAATAVIVSLAIVVAVAAGLAGGEAAAHWSAAPTATRHAVQPA